MCFDFWRLQEAVNEGVNPQGLHVFREGVNEGVNHEGVNEGVNEGVTHGRRRRSGQDDLRPGRGDRDTALSDRH